VSKNCGAARQAEPNPKATAACALTKKSRAMLVSIYKKAECFRGA
jgi:hypothetical protein